MAQERYSVLYFTIYSERKCDDDDDVVTLALIAEM